jgi:hypothetical protein
MVNRQVSRRKYVIAAVITAIVFSLGIIAGLLVEKGRLGYTADLIIEQKVDIASLQIQYEYLRSQKLERACPALQELFKSNLKSLDTSMKKVLNYKENSIFNEDRFKLLQREFTIEQVKYWLLANQMKDTCDSKHISAMLFYETKCPKCESQQFILEYFKRTFGENFLLFHFETDLEEPLIKLLTGQHNISSYPTTIIEGEKFEGLRGRRELQDIICSFYEEKPQVCIS